MIAVVDRASVDLSLVPDFSPGLEGVVAAETSISEVDGANGRLIYRGGYLIEDLAPVVTFEEAAYLLWQRQRNRPLFSLPSGLKRA